MVRQPIRDTITVTGAGSVSATPDTARISLTVAARHESSTRAHEAVANDAGRVIQALRALGVPERDIVTARLQLTTVPRFDEQHNQVGIAGYEVSTQLTVRSRKLDDLGRFVEAAVVAGATDIHGIDFTIEDPSPIAREARAAAMEDARDRAGQIAAAAGVEVAGVYAVREIFAPSPGAQPYGMPAGRMLRSAIEMPVNPGETEIRVEVEVTFEVTRATTT